MIKRHKKLILTEIKVEYISYLHWLPTIFISIIPSSHINAKKVKSEYLAVYSLTVGLYLRN